MTNHLNRNSLQYSPLSNLYIGDKNLILFLFCQRRESHYVMDIVSNAIDILLGGDD